MLPVNYSQTYYEASSNYSNSTSTSETSNTSVANNGTANITTTVTTITSVRPSTHLAGPAHLCRRPCSTTTLSSAQLRRAFRRALSLRAAWQP